MDLGSSWNWAQEFLPLVNLICYDTFPAVEDWIILCVRLPTCTFTLGDIPQSNDSFSIFQYAESQIDKPAHTTHAHADTSIYLQTGQVCENGCSEKHLPLSLCKR